MNNIKLIVEYDGTMYHGFQRQPDFHGPTIQGTLEDIIGKITEVPVTLYMAGRTDKGVHALGQVVNFYSNTKIPLEKIPKAFNSLLPQDIRIIQAEFVNENFNARFSAKWKRYVYSINNSPIASVFDRLYTFHVPQPLDVLSMSKAAEQMLGTRDFSAFCASGSPVKNFVRTLKRCDVLKDGTRIRIVCEADGFLYNMVRIIAGTLVDVGKGKIKPEAIDQILNSRNRTYGGITAPPEGLCLVHVEY